MEELGVPRGGWYQFDVELFRRFAAWALASCDLALLDVFQTMLNKEHRARFRSGLSLWNGDGSILEIKRSYEVSWAEMRKERQIADVEAGVALVTRAPSPSMKVLCKRKGDCLVLTHFVLSNK